MYMFNQISKILEIFLFYRLWLLFSVCFQLHYLLSTTLKMQQKPTKT